MELVDGFKAKTHRKRNFVRQKNILCVFKSETLGTFLLPTHFNYFKGEQKLQKEYVTIVNDNTPLSDNN